MKIKKFKFKQLLKLHLLKSRVYEHPSKKTNFNDLIHMNLDQILVDIKKALQIIFQYHQAEKRILFIGFPSKLELKFNLLTRHIAVPNGFNVQGVISNTNSKAFKATKSSTQAWLKKHSKLLLPKLMKKPDLIVLLNHDKSKAILSEAWIARIPVVVFSSIGEFNDSFLSRFYSVKGNFKNVLAASDKNIFFIALNFLFKNFKKKKTKSFPAPRKIKMQPLPKRRFK